MLVAMNKVTVIAILLAVLCAAGEKKVKMQDLPPAVQKAVTEQSQGATLVGLARETEDGKTFYEAELKINGRTRDISFDPTGKVVIVEDETPIENIPAPAREAIQKAAGKKKILLVETVTEDGKTFYEAHIRALIRTTEVKVDSAGKPVK